MNFRKNWYSLGKLICPLSEMSLANNYLLRFVRSRLGLGTYLFVRNDLGAGGYLFRFVRKDLGIGLINCPRPGYILLWLGSALAPHDKTTTTTTANNAHSDKKICTQQIFKAEAGKRIFFFKIAASASLPTPKEVEAAIWKKMRFQPRPWKFAGRWGYFFRFVRNDLGAGGYLFRFVRSDVRGLTSEISPIENFENTYLHDAENIHKQPKSFEFACRMCFKRYKTRGGGGGAKKMPLAFDCRMCFKRYKTRGGGGGADHRWGGSKVKIHHRWGAPLELVQVCKIINVKRF